MFSDITEYMAAELNLSEACVSGSTKFDACCLPYGGANHFEYYKAFVIPYNQRKTQSSSTGDNVPWSRYTSGSRYRSRNVKTEKTKKTDKSKIFIQLDVTEIVTDEVSWDRIFSGKNPENADSEGEKTETEVFDPINDLNPETMDNLKEITGWFCESVTKMP